MKTTFNVSQSANTFNTFLALQKFRFYNKDITSSKNLIAFCVVIGTVGEESLHLIYCEFVQWFCRSEDKENLFLCTQPLNLRLFIA